MRQLCFTRAFIHPFVTGVTFAATLT